MIQQHDGLATEHINSKVDPCLIAKYIVNWRQFAPYLGLTEPEISAITEDEPHEMLNEWIHKNGSNASYQCLLEVCLKAGDRELANRICQQLRGTCSNVA